MRIEDDIGLPAPILQAIQRGGIRRRLEQAEQSPAADYSVTELLRPAWQAALARRHGDAIVERASDRIWALLGSSVHAILESAEPQPGDIVERRLVSTDPSFGGVLVSGTPDYYCAASRTLYDFKVTSAWVSVSGVRQEWVEQLNSYRWLLEENGVPVERMQVAMILRDWSWRRASQGNGYPKAQVAVHDVAIRSSTETVWRLSERIAAHRSDAPPICTPAERWATPDSFAVVKAGRKRALKLYVTREEASAHSERAGKGHSVEDRPGNQWVRCDGYCAVSQFCSAYSERPKAKTTRSEEDTEEP